MLTEYQEIYQGEIFCQSQCIELENSITNFFRHNLELMNYTPVDLSKNIWRRDNKNVIISLVDDISTNSINNQNTAELFDSNTTVITDNRIYSPTVYRVLQLPNSFFGFYYYLPENTNFVPIKDVNLSINRLDPIRQIILLELIKHNSLDNIFKNLNINFNCFMHEQGLDQQSLIENFESVGKINNIARYQAYYEELLKHIPIKTHDLTVEQAMVGSYINMVIETYNGNNTVAISEKIFRALVTPAPWTVYSGRNTVMFLKSIGFDVLDDIVDHSYDCAPRAQQHFSVSNYVSSTLSTAQKLKAMPVEHLNSRVQKAAGHNQQLLKNLRSQWAADFAHWWADSIDFII
jgi:hypothetical protein